MACSKWERSVRLVAHTANGVILINDPLLSLLFPFFTASTTLSTHPSLPHLKNAFLIVLPISNGFDSIHFPYFLTMLFMSSLPLPSTSPCNKHNVNSPSSVICPGAMECGPPPGSERDKRILAGVIRVCENSRYVPEASPRRAPRMHPWAE